MDSCGLLALMALALVVSTSHAAVWSYKGDHGPTHWADIAPTCGGSMQSPIDLAESDMEHDANMGQFELTNFNKTTDFTWTLTNNGHSAQIIYTYTDATKRILVTGGGLVNTYAVEQFHFHWGADDAKGSEHTLDSKTYPMEVHIVTYNTKYMSVSAAANSGDADGLAVLGFFFEIGAHNSRIQTLVDQFGKIPKATNQTSVTDIFALNDFVADMTDYYRYQGGLTTPPCAEVVTWTVFAQTIPISSSQMEKFRELMNAEQEAIVDNYRPVQPLNGRKITTTLEVSAGSSSVVTSTFSAATIMCSLLVSMFSRL